MNRKSKLFAQGKIPKSDVPKYNWDRIIRTDMLTVPERFVISPEKTYKTRMGEEVVNLQVVIGTSTDGTRMVNMEGNVMVKSPSGKKKPVWKIWDRWGRNTSALDRTFDLMEVK